MADKKKGETLTLSQLNCFKITSIFPISSEYDKVEDMLRLIDIYTTDKHAYFF